MRNDPRRRLTLFDAVIVIAAAVASQGICRWLYPPAEGWPIWNMNRVLPARLPESIWLIC